MASIRKFSTGIQLEALASDPSSPIIGQIYYASGAGARTEGFYVYESDSTWHAVGAATGGGISAWVSAHSYSIGDVVYYTDNKIYRCTTANSDVAFTDSKWQSLSVESTGTSTAILKGNGSGGFSSASAGTDYQAPLGYTAESTGNKSTDPLFASANDTKYPSQLAVQSYVAEQGLKNYIINSSAFVDTTGWAAYADAAGSSPVDGTGGSPTATITRNTTTPLRGSADFLLTKDAANRQGQGCSYDFTIDSADQSRPMKFSFDYKTSANFSYANNDLVCYVYDKTNAVLIQPTPYTLDGSGRASLEFQSNAASTSYRIIFHIATTNASAWTFEFTNVVVSNNSVQPFCTLQDTEYDISSYLSASPGISTIYKAVAIPYKTKTGTCRIKGNISYNASSSAQEHDVSISGITFSGASSNAPAVDFTQSSGLSAAVTIGRANGGGNTMVGYYNASVQSIGITFDLSITAMPTWAVDYYPVQLSNGAETRVVAASAGGSVGSTSGGTPLIFPTIRYDKTSSYNTTTGQYKVPVAGVYKLYGSAPGVAGSTGYLHLYVNGSYDSIIGQITSAAQGIFCGSYNANVGDLLDVRPNGTYNPGSSNITFERISGPATMAASEKVYAEYNTSAGQSISGTTLINYGSKIKDTHNAVTTGIGSWRFTAPRTGIYDISTFNLLSAASYSSAHQSSLYIYINGSNYKTLIRNQIAAANSSFYMPMNSSTSIYLNAGEYINYYVQSDSATNLFSSSDMNWITISSK
jgi:hypothetical protein